MEILHKETESVLTLQPPFKDYYILTAGQKPKLADNIYQSSNSSKFE